MTEQERKRLVELLAEAIWQAESIRVHERRAGRNGPKWARKLGASIAHLPTQPLPPPSGLGSSGGGGMARPRFSRQPYASLNVYFTDELMQKMRQEAARRRVSMSELVRRAVESELAETNRLRDVARRILKKGYEDAAS